MENINTINIKEFQEKSVKDCMSIILDKDYYSLSKEFNTILIGSSPYKVLHKTRNREEALASGKKKGDFCSERYIVVPANLVMASPMIDCVKNFDCIHSIEELNEYHDAKIKEAEDSLKQAKEKKDFAIENAFKYGLPDKNPKGFSKETDI